MKKYLLIILLLFITGCSTAVSSNKAEPVITDQNKASENFQYSAPWDKELFAGFYSQAPEVKSSEKIKGGIVPHHLIAGRYNAAFFDYVGKQKPSVIVVIGPNHFSRGRSDVIVSSRNWQTPYGELKTDTGLVNKLLADRLALADESVIAEEHSVYTEAAFIAHSSPQSKYLPIILKNNLSQEKMDQLISELASILPTDAVIVASIDFSHYQNNSVADFHDQLSKAVIANFDYDQFPKLEIDSTPSLYVVAKLMEKFGSQKIINYFHSNSGVLAGNYEAENTTSHLVFFFGKGEKENKKYFSLVHFGDLMLDRNVKKQIDKNGFDYLLKNLAGEENRFFSGADIFMANLEGPFADSRRQTTKSIAFRFDPVLIPKLKKYNLTLFNLANNHTLDMSVAGFAEAKKNLEKGGIEFFGKQIYTGPDSLYIKDLGKAKVAFIGLDDTITPVNINEVKSLIAKAKSEADFILVSIHWGAEYQLLKSNKRQQDLAHSLIDAGADAIIGHHPHVTQEMEIYNNKPIFYSLGNFIFDQYFSVPTQESLGVGLFWEEGVGLSLHLFPLKQNLSAVSLMSYPERKSWLQKFIASSRIGNNIENNYKINLNP